MLLQRDRGYFTAGFLSEDYLGGLGQTVAFLLLSVVTDAAVAGLFAGLVMWGLSRARIRPLACCLAGFLAGVTPLVVTDIISYRIVQYLGDSADIALMFDLVGGDASEILAVAWSFLVAPTAAVMGAAVLSCLAVWLVHRREATGAVVLVGRRFLWAPVLMFVVGLVASTAASTVSDVLDNGLRRKPAGRAVAMLARAATDIDRDGYGVAGRFPDPAPFNRDVYPYAIDIPGNGIDENGVGGDLPVNSPLSPQTELSPTNWARRPDVVLFVLESFRADLVGAQLDGQAITPVMNQIAELGVASKHAYSHNGYTTQSRFHLMTGQFWPGEQVASLVDDFARNGYRVGYISGQDESFGGSALGVGFDRADVSYDARSEPALRYTTSSTAGSLAVPMAVVEDKIADFLSSSMENDAPIFLYVNFHDTHFPYWHEDIDTLVSSARLARGEIAPSQIDELWATYANSSANVDRAIGAVIDELRRVRGTEPGVIITSDHGESLFDEGFLGHGYALNDVQTRVPLIISGLPMVIPEPFAQADLRQGIDAALRLPPTVPSQPRLTTDGAREIFQYLGTLARPRQIAFLGATGRTIYDFRDHRIQFGEGDWLEPDTLDEAARTEFERLVHFWERLAQQGGSRGSQGNEADGEQ